MANANKIMKFNFKDGKSIKIELGKIVHSTSKKEMLYFDKIYGDKWRVIVSEKTLSNFNDIDNITFSE